MSIEYSSQKDIGCTDEAKSEKHEIKADRYYH
jgi:hypothetical protein